jgi:hypothetical protein
MRVWTLLQARCRRIRSAIARRITACTRLLTLGPRLGVDLAASRQLIEEGQALADASGDRAGTHPADDGLWMGAGQCR